MLYPAVLAAALVSSSAPYPGVDYSVYFDDVAGARVHVVAIDLSSKEIHLVATEPGQRGARPSDFAVANDLQIVVNGDAFSPVDFQPAGLAMGGGTVWTGTADDARSGFFRFDRNADENGASISPPEEVVDAMALPVGTIGVVSGRPMIVRAGIQQSSFDCDDLIAMPCIRAPRTAVALSVDRKRMWLAVVDGWQTGSAGMTAAELGAFLEGLGAHDALLLDGGASSALVIDAEGGLVSSPSDGVERPVANHLAIRFGSLPPGELFGIVRECDILNEGAELDGVAVELDDGQRQVTGPDGRYSFPNLTPRLACVTASKPGYVTKTQCRQVQPSVVTFNSIGLAPVTGCPTPDAGPLPDAGPEPDATATPDAGSDPDAGPTPDGGGDVAPEGGCGCTSGGAGAPAAALVVCALLLAVAPRERRRR